MHPNHKRRFQLLSSLCNEIFGVIGGRFGVCWIIIHNVECSTLVPSHPQASSVDYYIIRPEGNYENSCRIVNHQGEAQKPSQKNHACYNQVTLHYWQQGDRCLAAVRIMWQCSEKKSASALFQALFSDYLSRVTAGSALSHF